MRLQTFSFIFSMAITIMAMVFFFPNFQKSIKNNTDLSIKIATSTVNLLATSTPVVSEQIINLPIPKKSLPISKPIPNIAPLAVVKEVIKEVSSKSLGELINSSVVQLYCGYFSDEGATFSDISRGTGIIINPKGEILTNRHIIYDENLKKARNDCFVLKSPFPNEKSQNPKIYYFTEIVGYPAVEKFSDSFSEDKYYNDFAILKIISKISSESKVNLILGFDYASLEDYSVLENNNLFNYLPIDWDYNPKDGDFLITLGYGVDASHMANKITSTIGKLIGNINTDGSLKPQILLIESNATAGFSGGALINPQSKGLIGLISWITSGDEPGKYTVAIFRDFLRDLMFQDLNFELK
ncbi:trypsin-like peptidase domain-containing protein [Patescibacteria group bacterium]|nr:trypsin-like peptidase domain-containing protein [Patescibacteria group bacterium]